MWRFLKFAVVPFAVMSASPSVAGIYADDLAKCFVAKSTPSDQAALMRWMFAAFSAGPAVKEMTSITTSQRQGYTKAGSDLFSRLLLTDCRSAAVSALKYEGGSALERSFGILGEVAARGLAADPAVQKELEGLGSHMDEAATNALLKEAGIQPPTATKEAK